MTLPDGSGAILCPVGKEYSMISDEVFQSRIEEGFTFDVSPEAWGAWYANARRVRVKLEVQPPSPGETVVVEGVVTQWEVRNFLPIQENLGEHPYPSLYAVETSDGGTEIIHKSPTDTDSLWRYLCEGSGEPGVVSGDYFYNPSWELFIHRDKFYFRMDSAISFNTLESFSLTPTTMTLVTSRDLGDGDIETSTITHTITDTFYKP